MASPEGMDFAILAVSKLEEPMKPSLFALSFFVTLPSAAHAVIEVVLSREAKDLN